MTEMYSPRKDRPSDYRQPLSEAQELSRHSCDGSLLINALLLMVFWVRLYQRCRRNMNRWFGEGQTRSGPIELGSGFLVAFSCPCRRMSCRMSSCMCPKQDATRSDNRVRAHEIHQTAECRTERRLRRRYTSVNSAATPSCTDTTANEALPMT